MNTRYLSKLTDWLFSFVYLQLCITLTTLPILLYWGIPISLLSIIGNLLFSPFLTAFLFLCTIIFFTQLLAIPNSIFIKLADYIVQVWLYVMSIPSKNALYYLPQPPWFIIMIIAIASYIILHQKIIISVWKKNILLLVMVIGCGFLINYNAPHVAPISQLECNGGAITIICCKNKLCIIDPGVIGKTLSAPDWIEYTLIPHLTKKFGTTHITDFIALQPGYSTFLALEKLTTIVDVKAVYIPYWQGMLSKSALRKWFLFKKSALLNNCSIIRLADKKYSIDYKEQLMTITSLPTVIEPKPDYSYNAFEIIINNDIHIVSNKYKKMRQ